MSQTVSGSDVGYQYEVYLGPLTDSWAPHMKYRYQFKIWDAKQYGRMFIDGGPFKVDIAPDLVEWFAHNGIQWYAHERYALDSITFQIDTKPHAMMFKLRWLVDI